MWVTGAKLEDQMHHQDILLHINTPTEHNSKKNSLVDRVTDCIYASMKGGEMVSFLTTRMFSCFVATQSSSLLMD